MAVRTAVLACGVSACLVLAGCDGNPWVADPLAGGGSGSGDASVSSLTSPAGRGKDGSITRIEVDGKGSDFTATGGAAAPAVLGNGFAFRDGNIHYNAADDTFEVDNLAFDGGNVYTRSPAFKIDAAGPDIGPARLYEGAGTFPDTQTGALIDQFSYRALYGVSSTGRSHFAIVRTGAYRPYGFGGFIYSRTGGVVLPTGGQATYNGTYAGLRDFDGQSGLQITSGNMDMSIDFEDFNPDESGLDQASGITGHVTNRQVFDLAGNNITAAVVAEINSDKGSSLGALPDLNFYTGFGFLDTSGEAESLINNYVDLKEFEAGKYYAVISGDNADEVVGVIVVTSNIGQVTVRETGGFILYRP